VVFCDCFFFPLSLLFSHPLHYCCTEPLNAVGVNTLLLFVFFFFHFKLSNVWFGVFFFASAMNDLIELVYQNHFVQSPIAAREFVFCHRSPDLENH